MSALDANAVLLSGPWSAEDGAFEVVFVELLAGSDGQLVLGAERRSGAMPREDAAELALTVALFNAAEYDVGNSCPHVVYVRPVEGC